MTKENYYTNRIVFGEKIPVKSTRFLANEVAEEHVFIDVLAAVYERSHRYILADVFYLFLYSESITTLLVLVWSGKHETLDVTTA